MTSPLTLANGTTTQMTRVFLGSAGAIMLIFLAACSSSKKTKRSEFGPTYNERLSTAEKAMKNSSSSVRSSFERQIPKSTTDKTYSASVYNARNAAGMNKFPGSDSAYRSKNFSEAGKKDSIGFKKAREMEAQNKLASRLFRTPDSRFDAKTSRDDKKTFNQSDETFKTGENQIGAKEMEKNTKPLILEPEKPTYSEDEVKRLLNKG